MYKGIFEAHVTVENGESPLILSRFTQICQQLEIKPVLIELPQGVAPSQLMTASYHKGTLAQVKTQIFNQSKKLEEADFKVIRIKIEAMVRNQDIPITDQEVKQHSSDNYFEFHIKAILSEHNNLDDLRQLCEQHSAHLSTNAFQKLSEQKHSRFITLRFYQLGFQSALNRFNNLITSLKEQKIIMAQHQLEYTVFDSNLQLDSGWM